MAGIAGIFSPGQSQQVRQMLDRVAHRGGADRAVLQLDAATLGAVWSPAQPAAGMYNHTCVRDCTDDGHLALAAIVDGKPLLRRDPLGVAPLYYGRTASGSLCFASEVKALLPVSRDVHEFPPGCEYDGVQFQPYFRLQPPQHVEDRIERATNELRLRLARAVEHCVAEPVAGAWLSGGLDSSTIAALLRPHVSMLHTFAAGLPGAADLAYAREVASHIKAEHHEVILSAEQMLAVLPLVIFHLESFDAALVRSSVTNYLVARVASQFVPMAFTGEGGTELFAGFDYLKSIDPVRLGDELIQVLGRMHNTSLQRVDRCANAHGVAVHVPFLAPEVVEYAMCISPRLKLCDGIGKYILRRAVEGLVPPRVLTRSRADFWEGAGVGELMERYAADHISDADYRRERVLPNGWTLAGKEELLYYRIFQEHFGHMSALDWMGRMPPWIR